MKGGHQRIGGLYNVLSHQHLKNLGFAELSAMMAVIIQCPEPS